ncbi:MAG TPA: dihydropteroate synthase [Bacteroidia bacterium]
MLKNLKFPHNSLDLTTPRVMGILNVTPDSFFDGGKYISREKIIVQVEKMLKDGASIIDVGGYSTRPGAGDVPVQEELGRLIPAIKTIREHFPSAIISADTFRGAVAREAVAAGAGMINDVSGGTLDEKMLDAVAELNVPYVLMHTRGSPQTMKEMTDYKDVFAEVMNYFVHRINLAISKGVTQLIIDPGFGFAKTTEQNYILLNRLSEFQKFGFPVLVGVSRKSMINKVLGTKAAEALNGTTVVNTIALMNGADILRVHDVREAMEAVKIVNFVKRGC